MRRDYAVVSLVYHCSFVKSATLDDVIEAFDNEEFQTEADAAVISHEVTVPDDFEIHGNEADIPVRITFELHGDTNVQEALDMLVDPCAGSGSPVLSCVRVRSDLLEEEDDALADDDADRADDFYPGRESLCPNCGAALYGIDDDRLTRIICDACGCVMGTDIDATDEEDDDY